MTHHYHSVSSSREVRARVVTERKLRYGSQRRAADAGGVSNTTWGRYEKGGDLTDRMRLAVAKAFDWPADWPDLPVSDRGDIDRPTALDILQSINRKVDGLDELNRRIEAAVDRALAGLASVGQLPVALEAAGQRAVEVEALMRDLLARLPVVPASPAGVPSKRPSKPRKTRSPQPSARG